MESNLSSPPPTKSGYSVARASGTCSISGVTIAPGDAFIAGLRETAEGFERIDIALAATKEVDLSSFVAHWRAVMPTTQQKRRLLVDDATLCDIFVRLEDAHEPAKIAFRFVLALLLMRKKMLSYESSERDGERELWNVRLKGHSQPMQMIDAKPSEEMVQQVSAQLSAILNEGDA